MYLFEKISVIIYCVLHILNWVKNIAKIDLHLHIIIYILNQQYIQMFWIGISEFRFVEQFAIADLGSTQSG